jgi:hypothetical protein
MNRSFAAGFLLLALAVFTGCEPTEYSEAKYADATVAECRYAPGQHGSSSGIAITGKGDVGPAFGSVDVSESYAVVLDMGWAKWTESGSYGLPYELWKKLRVGERVTVKYRDIIKVRKDGSRYTSGCELLDANPKD